jgi:hypothetical protein
MKKPSRPATPAQPRAISKGLPVAGKTKPAKPARKGEVKPKPAARSKVKTKAAPKPKKEVTILTRHPDKSKTGVNISKEKYKQVKEAILESIPAGKGISFDKLLAAVEKKLGKKFDGSPSWYATTVKLDLEARKLIKRSGDSPQMITKK